MRKDGAADREKSRLRALRSFWVLDEAAPPAFDCVVQAASALCGTPIALVSLVDEGRLYFMARAGLDVTQVPSSNSLCNYAVQLPEGMLEVPDASADLRFADSPLVTGPPGIRFYAGAPLVMSDNETIGTLCVIDRSPRELTESQRVGLLALAEITVQLLESRRRELTLASALQQFDRG